MRFTCKMNLVVSEITKKQFFHHFQNPPIALVSSAWEWKELPSRAVRKQLCVICPRGFVTATTTVETFQMRETAQVGQHVYPLKYPKLFWNGQRFYIMYFVCVFCLTDKRKLKCPVNFFACPSGRCIPMSWTCDKENDCENGADETHCGQSATKLSSNTLIFIKNTNHSRKPRLFFLRLPTAHGKTWLTGTVNWIISPKCWALLDIFLQTNFAHPPSLNVGTTAAFPPTGCVTAPMTVVMVLMRTRNAVSDILLTSASVKVLFSHAQF